MHDTPSCRLCEEVNSEKSLLHFTSCTLLLKNVPKVSNVDPDDIYGDTQTQIKATHVWMKVFDKLDDKILTTQAHSSSTVPQVC